MQTMAKDRLGIEVADDGYVAGVRCNKYHSGNKRLAGPTVQAYECQGCRQFYSAGDVRDMQAQPVGAEKVDGLRRVESS